MRISREWRYDTYNAAASISNGMANFAKKHEVAPNGITCRPKEENLIRTALEKASPEAAETLPEISIEVSSLLLPGVVRIWHDNRDEE